MSHEHRDYLESNLPAMRDIWVDFVWKGKTATTQLLNGEGMALWYIITERIANNLLYMSLDAMSEATGISVQGVRKRLAAFGEAGWLIDLGFQKHGKYAKTKTYEVILDVLGVGHLPHSEGESKNGAQGGASSGAHGGSHGGARNNASPTEITESSPNPIPNTNPTPTRATHEPANNIDNTPSTEAGEMKTRIDNIVSLCIELERNNTFKPIGKPLEAKLHREYATLITAELQSREWLSDEKAADVCYAKRNGKTPPQCTRPPCSTCFGKNRDIDGLHGHSTICIGDTYVICPKCDGDGYKPLKALTQNMFTNLNTKGHTHNE
jgi:hypothetical protein